MGSFRETVLFNRYNEESAIDVELEYVRPARTNYRIEDENARTIFHA